MKRILIDLTDLEQWSGQHGGTQRVVYGIAKQYYLHEPDGKQSVEFIAFSAQGRAFYVTDFAPILERTERHKVTESAADPPRLPLTARLKYRLRPYVPEPLRQSPLARQAATRTLSAAVRAAKTGRQAVHRYARPRATRRERVVFTKDDVVLILGKPWDDLDIQRTLTAEKTRTGFKLVQVVYDLIIPLQPQLHHPSLFKPYTQHMFEAISASDLLLPISKSSERDLKTFAKALNLPMPKTKVIRLADEVIDTPPTAEAKPDPRIAEAFIACIGTIEIRKNHLLLYYAYKLALSKGQELPQLVIVGSRGWLSADVQYLLEHDPAIRDKIIIMDRAGDTALDWIYRNCLFTVYPSMYEGWGLPVAESLAYGKPCVASNSSSIPEIAGNLVDYFSPYDPEECLSKITKHLDPHELTEAAGKLKTYKTTAWKDTYNQVKTTIERMV